MSALGLALLRLTIAALSMAHGLHVLFGVMGGPGPGAGGLEMTAARFQAAGLQPGHVMAVIAGLVLLGGGVLLAAGWFTRWAALAVALYTAIIMWFFHVQWGLFLNWTAAPGSGHGIEYDLLIVAALVCLMLVGPGDYSIDGRRSRYAASRAAGRARLRRS